MRFNNYVTYVKNSFVLKKMREVNLNYIEKSEIIVITPKNLEKLLIVFAI